jgi:hypothetical protein
MRGKIFLQILLLVPLLAAGTATTQQQKPVGAARFEGLLDMSLTMETGSGDLQLSLSGDMAKLDMQLLINPVPQPIRLAVLMDQRAPKTAYLLSDMTRTYSSINLSEAANLTDDSKAKGKFKVKNMGQEKILGFAVTHVTLTRENELIDAWITKDMPDVYAVLKRLQEANPQIGEAALFKALDETGYSGLPMRCIVVRDGQRVTTEVKKVERRSLPASLFTIPKDYARTEGGAAGLAPTQDQVEEMKKMIQGALEKD